MISSALFPSPTHLLCRTVLDSLNQFPFHMAPWHQISLGEFISILESCYFQHYCMPTSTYLLSTYYVLGTL